MSISDFVPSVVLAALAAAAPAVEVAVRGSVAIDSGSTVPVNAPAKDLVLSWRQPDGALVHAGDVLLRFDTTLIERLLIERRGNAEAAAIEYQRQVANRAGELEGVESQRRSLRAELASARAWIALAETKDSQRLELLHADLRAARMAADIAAREATRVAADRQQGRVSALDAESADRNAAAALRAVTRPQLALTDFESPPEVPVDTVNLHLWAEDVAIRLGLAEDGSEDPALGIGARIAAAKSQGEADLATRRIDLERIQAELHEAERDVHDCTPLAAIVVSRVGEDAPLVQVRFLPAGRKPPADWSADHGLTFASGRGWDRQLEAGELLFRETTANPLDAGAPPAGAGRPRSGKRKGGGKPASAGGAFTGGLALIARPAHWSLDVQSGRYRVTAILGDDRAWDGASIRVEGQPMPLPARVGAGRSEQTIEVEVADGRLDVQIGDGETKAVRAATGGSLILQGQAQIGFRVRDPSWSLGFLAAPEARVVDTLVLQDLAPLLKPGRVVAGADAPLSDRLSLTGAVLRGPDGAEIPAEVVSVGAQDVPFGSGERSWDAVNPADAIARELRLKPSTDGGDRLLQGESIDVVLRFTVPEGCTALPPHLVRIDRDGSVIRRRGRTEDEPVTAFRLGGSTVVDREVDAASLVPPPPRRSGPVGDDLGRFRGEVVPGARTRVSLHWIWGRVESLVEDGSQVQVGDIILTVYNPQMEADRERIERDRRAGVQRVVAAAERRRQDLTRAQGDHAARRVAEAKARLALRRQLDPDPLGREAADGAVQQASIAVTAATDRLRRYEGLTVPDLNELATSRYALASAGIGRDRAALSAAAWELRLDWLQGRELAATWIDTVDALARRDAELAEAAVQERINTLADRIAMERAVEGNWWQRHFANRRNLVAPVSGRILFQTGWNDQTQRSEKIDREFPVWGGMTVAEIVDEKTLRFATELPEDSFPGLAPGSPCEIEFESAPGQPVPATFSELGRAFIIPHDRLVGDADDTVSNRRAFSAVVSFKPPEELRRRLSTGAKGWIRLP